MISIPQSSAGAYDTYSHFPRLQSEWILIYPRRYILTEACAMGVSPSPPSELPPPSPSHTPLDDVPVGFREGASDRPACQRGPNMVTEWRGKTPSH